MTEAKFNFFSDATGGDQFTVVSFSGNEAISALYQYELEIKSPLSAATDLDDLLDNPARFITEIDGHEYPVYGVLSSIDELRTVQGYVYYRAVLVPRLWWLSTYKTNEIYTDEQTVDVIIQTVLNNAGLFDGTDFDLAELDDRHFLERDYRCQFGESDFDFISRLMENEGIFYYFDHSGDVEKIIFINDLNYLDIPHPGLIFDVAGQTNRQHDCISAWSCRKQRLATGVTVRDFNPDQPSLDISDTVPIDSMGQGTEYLYGENIIDKDEATYLAEIRAEERLCHKTRYYGESAVTRLQAGYLFALNGHPNSGYNGIEYLVTEVHHEGLHLDMVVSVDSQASAKTKSQYRNDFVAIDATIQFRPGRNTPKPRFYGTMTAFIYAEAATMKAEIDEYGRYRVHLPFDRADGTLLSTDPHRKASTWIRMAQPYVGQEQGMYYPLTGGTEVLLTFINGDPDLPIISGAVPNASQPSLLTSNTNYQRTVTTQPSQTVTGNTHRVSRNSAYLATSDEVPMAPSPSGESSGGGHTSLSAAALQPSTVAKTYINEFKTDNAAFKTMIPPWSLPTGGAAEWSAASPAYDPGLIKFKLYRGDFSSGIMGNETFDAHGEGSIGDDKDTATVDESTLVSTDRGGGDTYIYANGRTFAYPQHERVYFIGTFHEDFHVKDDFLDDTISWTGVVEQFNFPAPGGKFPDGTGPFPIDDADDPDDNIAASETTDTKVNPSGIRGVSEDKRWGDQMAYAWGRSFNWAGGPAMGGGDTGSFGVYNYGNGYTENLQTLAGGTSTEDGFPYTGLKDQWDYTPGGTPAVPWNIARVMTPISIGLSGLILAPVKGAIWAASLLIHETGNSLTQTWQLNPGSTAVEKTFGHKYEYHMGLAVGIHEGNSISKTYGHSAESINGNSESYVWGDSVSTAGGTSSEAFLGSKYEFNFGTADTLTIGVNTDTFIGAQFEYSIAGKLVIDMFEAKEITLVKKKEAAPAKEEITAKDLQTSIEKNTNALKEIRSALKVQELNGSFEVMAAEKFSIISPLNGTVMAAIMLTLQSGLTKIG